MSEAAAATVADPGLGEAPRLSDIRPDAMLLALDLALVHAWLGGAASTGAVLAVHSAAALSLFAPAIVWDARLRGPFACRLVLALLLGPANAVVALTLFVGRLFRRPLRGMSAPVAGTGAAGSATTEDRLVQRIAEGRAHPGITATAPFVDTLATGDLAARNRVIAAISRNYRGQMFPALMAALNSDTPAIRVQAAAIYAALRERLVAEAKGALARDLPRALSAPEQRAEADGLCELARSGFLDDATIAALTARAGEIEAGLGRPAKTQARPGRAVTPADAPAALNEPTAALKAQKTTGRVR